MLVLDKSFELIERIRVDIGKRYFDIGSDLSKLEQLELRKGDEYVPSPNDRQMFIHSEAEIHLHCTARGCLQLKDMNNVFWS